MDDLHLTACYFTLTGAPPGEPPRFGLLERAEAARAAGFAAISLAPDDLAIARAAGLSAADLRERLDEIGIAVTDLEALRGWEAGDGAAREAEEAMYELADAFGARRMVAIQLAADVPPEAVAERFAGVCDRAAAHGLQVAFEPRADSPVETPAAAADLLGRALGPPADSPVETPTGAADPLRRAFDPPAAPPAEAPTGAADLLEGAGRPVAGIVIDIYHAHRVGWGAAEVLAAGVPVALIHLNDTTLTPLDPPLRDALENRLAPGEGDLDVRAFLASLAAAAGIEAPFAVEVLSAAARELPVAEAARRAFDGARAALA